MARCDNCWANKVCDHHRFGFENCGSYISTADVAPKSEVARLEQDVTRLVQEKDNLIKNYAECMKDFAREIFGELEQNIFGDSTQNLIIMTAKTFAELKKKYTEDEG